MSAVQCRISFFLPAHLLRPCDGANGGVLYWLQDLQQIQASVGASAATLREGSTVNGHMEPTLQWCAIHEIQHQLWDVRQVAHSSCTSAPTLSDGFVAAWAFDCAVAMLQTSSLSLGVMLAAAAAAMECSIICSRPR